MKILIIGDALIDKYTYANTTRQSPENKDIAVWDVSKRVDMPGGALNVAAKLAALREHPVYLSAIVQHECRSWLKNKYKVLEVEELCSTTHAPLTKERLIDEKTAQQMLRIDDGLAFGDGCIEDFQTHFDRHCHLLDAFDSVVVSDYCKGTITNRIIEHLARLHCPVFVDTKRSDLSVWRKLKECFVKINLKEFTQCFNEHWVNLIVTRGSSGSILLNQDGSFAARVKGRKVRNANCIGAGDAYLAGLVDGYVGQEMPIDQAMKHADAVARESVSTALILENKQCNAGAVA